MVAPYTLFLTFNLTVAPAHNFYPKILREGSAKLRWAGPRDLIFHSLCTAVCMWSIGVKKAFDVGGPSWIDFIYFWGRMKSSEAASLRWAGGGGAQRPVWGGSELKKTGARSARARTRGQNPLVLYITMCSMHGVVLYTVSLEMD